MDLLPLESPRATAVLTLALVVIVGTAFGSLARRLRLPSMTGQIFAGLLMGRAGWNVFGAEAVQELHPITDFALGLMAVTVGGHLNLKRLRHAGRRLFLLLVAEATITPVAVLLVMWSIGGRTLGEAVLYATVAVATAPATIVALVKENRARGVFVKTLVAAVALNNLACIVLFELARATLTFHGGTSSSVAELTRPALGLLAASAIGAAIGLGMHWVSARTVGRERLATAGVVALLLAVGVALFLRTSPLLVCLFLGLVQTNLTPEKTKLVDSVFEDFEPVILTVFFTLAGLHLTLARGGLVLSLALAFVLARIGGKLLAARVALSLAGATTAVRRHLGTALIPQAGVAVGLVLLIQEDPSFAAIADLFAAVVLTAVAANELVGPLFTRRALARSGELGTDRSRLLDFLQEENIVTNLSAKTKSEAIAQLVELLVRAHHLPEVDRETLLASVLVREEEASTCFGGGLAIPHGELRECTTMYGVMGLSRKGLDFPTPDGAPVHCIVLLATPVEQRQRHLEVLAALAQTIGTDFDLRQRLFDAQSPAHAYEILHADTALSFNYFLEAE